jgi:hypothetical protein
MRRATRNAYEAGLSKKTYSPVDSISAQVRHLHSTASTPDPCVCDKLWLQGLEVKAWIITD